MKGAVSKSTAQAGNNEAEGGVLRYRDCPARVSQERFEAEALPYLKRLYGTPCRGRALLRQALGEKNVSCDPESVTAYVDGFLEGVALASVEAHLAGCPACREQDEWERELRARLKGLPAPEPRPGFEGHLRRRIRSSRRRRGLWLVPLAAGLTALALLGRGSPALVAWEVSRDHSHCFGQTKVPAKVWSSDPVRVGEWFEKQGTAIPPLRAGAGGLELLGARYCLLPDATFVPHVYYSSAEGHLSLFLIPRRLRLAGSYAATTGDNMVRMLPMGESTLALVSEKPAQVDTFERLFATKMATLMTTGDRH